jgi:hypothetical protein
MSVLGRSRRDDSTNFVGFGSGITWSPDRVPQQARSDGREGRVPSQCRDLAGQLDRRPLRRPSLVRGGLHILARANFCRRPGLPRSAACASGCARAPERARVLSTHPAGAAPSLVASRRDGARAPGVDCMTRASARFEARWPLFLSFIWYFEEIF